MKNIFRFLMAVAVLFTASCAKEDISSSIAGGEVEVTFTANLPELGTRAYGEGEHATTLKFFVYEYENENVIGKYLPDVKIYKADNEEGTNVITSTNKHFDFSLTLIKGMKYNIVFWADKGEYSPYSPVLDTNGAPTGVIKANYSDVYANDDSLDAFFGSLKNFDPAAADAQSRAGSIELKRPFAQLNAKTTDLTEIQRSGATLFQSALAVKAYTTLDLFSGNVGGLDEDNAVVFKPNSLPDSNGHISMNYLLAPTTKCTADVTLSYTFVGAEVDFPATTYSYVPLQRNYRTNIIGKLLTATTDFEVEIKPGFDAAYDVEGETITAEVDTAEELIAALEDDSIDAVVLSGDINLNDLLTRANNDPSLTIKSGKELTIDLNGKKLSSTSTEIGKNYNMFDVRGTLTVKNGTIEYEHLGENMGWGSSTNLFNVTAGGVLNLEGVTAKNLGGSDMGFVAHLNNWGEVTLNAENCTLESNYVPVRVFNSGYDMNNVTIKNSTLNGVSAAFWVHNYTVEDFGSEDKAEAQKALLNLNIYNQGNTFSPDLNGIRYGFTNSIRSDAYGITKTVSEDGTEVTLGSIVEDGLIRRGVAGAEENNTIKKVVVGEGVTTLYDRTFRRFYALETVELPSTLTTIGADGSGVFQSCTALKNIVLPESVTALGKGTFQECSSLESINIPAGVTRIEENCLRATGLVKVEFHSGVTYFGAQAFRDCKQLKEVVINAPVFTIEANCFGSMAAPYPAVTIYVANAEMKAYLESTLSYISQFEIVAPNTVSSADDLIEALENGKDVIFEDDVKIEPANMSNAYGATGINVKNGQTIDGNGHILDIKGAGGTWDSGISTTGGVIKNITVTGSFRGIFINHNSDYSGKVILENVTTTGTVYTISCDQGTNNGLEATNCSFYGWTSYAATLGDAKFVNCTFGEGSGYAYCRPYAPTEFVGCKFEAGFTVDPIANISFENCTLDGVALTAENISTLVTDASKVTVK